MIKYHSHKKNVDHHIPNILNPGTITLIYTVISIIAEEFRSVDASNLILQ